MSSERSPGRAPAWADGLSVLGSPVAVLTLVTALFVGHLLAYDFVSDDGFIALRYARNAAHGLGLVYNPGERVEGYTSQLWVLLLAAGIRLGAEPLVLARVLGALAAIGTLFATWSLARALRPPASPTSGWSLLAPAIVAANGSFACWAAAGLETSLFSLWIALTFALELSEHRRRWSPWTAGLAALTRPEGLLVVLLLWVRRLLRRREDRAGLIQGTVIPGLLVASGLLARRAYYGEWLPNTFFAKVGGRFEQLARGLGYASDYALDHEGVVVLGLVVAIFFARGDARQRWVAWGALALWGGTVLVGGDGLPMYRFALPALPLLAALEAELLASAWPWLSGWLGRGALPVEVVLGASLLWTHLTPPAVGSHFLLYADQKQLEVPRWTRVGKWLAAHRQPGDSVALVPIGAVGEYSQLPVVDMLGLVDKHIAHARAEVGSGWAGHERHDGAYVLARKPTWLLLGNVDVTREPRDPGHRPFIPITNPNIWARERDVAEDPRLLTDYEPFTAKLGEGEYLNGYHRKMDVP